mgnify:CR=1 FL=1
MHWGVRLAHSVTHQCPESRVAVNAVYHRRIVIRKISALHGAPFLVGWLATPFHGLLAEARQPQAAVGTARRLWTPLAAACATWTAAG